MNVFLNMYMVFKKRVYAYLLSQPIGNIHRFSAHPSCPLHKVGVSVGISVTVGQRQPSQAVVFVLQTINLQQKTQQDMGET